MGDLEVTGTLDGGIIKGAEISGATINGSEIHGSSIYFGDSVGYAYKIYNANGDYLDTRVYSEKLPSDTYYVGDRKYVYTGVENGTDAGKLIVDTGDDTIGTTMLLALDSTGTQLPIVIKADERILIRNTGEGKGSEDEDDVEGNWVGL